MGNTFNLKKIYYKFNMGISFLAFSAYFQDKNDFNNFLATLSEKKREKFFRLSKFYNDFVRNPLIEDESTKKYFSLIMIFSLIEATMSETKHLTFDQYLFKNFKSVPDKKTLGQIQNKYLDKFGSQKQVKKFFDDYVDEECKKIFAHAICVNSDNKQEGLSIDEKIKQNIELFYQWRSNFVHHADIPGAFQESSLQANYVTRKNKKITFSTGYPRRDFEQLFEHGFLRYFGYIKNFEHKNIEEKIERYKNHTTHKACKQKCENLKNLKIYQ